MSLRATERTVDGAVGLLLGIQLLTCFVAIVMLARLRAPLDAAVVESTRDAALVEQQLARLVRVIHSADPALASAYLEATDELRQHLGAGQAEARLLITQDATLALAGDAAAVERSVRALSQIADGARLKLKGTEQTLAFQSRAAAWVLVFLGGTLILLASMVRGWLNRSLVVPLGELARVIEARVHGDARARVAPLSQGEALATTLSATNQLLDAMEELEAMAQENAASRALTALLDHRGDAAVILTQGNHVVAMSQSALELLSTEAGASFRSSLAVLEESFNPDPRLSVEVLDSDHRLCRLHLDKN